MSTRFTLISTVVLLILDILFTYFYITQPQRDRVHGGLGQGLMVMYGLGVILLLVVYGVAFLVVYYKQWFTAAKTMCLLLGGLNVLFLLLLLMFWLKR
jgi:hypothetical protein